MANMCMTFSAYMNLMFIIADGGEWASFHKSIKLAKLMMVLANNYWSFITVSSIELIVTLKLNSHQHCYILQTFVSLRHNLLHYTDRERRYTIITALQCGSDLQEVNYIILWEGREEGGGRLLLHYLPNWSTYFKHTNMHLLYTRVTDEIILWSTYFMLQLCTTEKQTILKYHFECCEFFHERMEYVCFL